MELYIVSPKVVSTRPSSRHEFTVILKHYARSDCTELPFCKSPCCSNWILQLKK